MNAVDKLRIAMPAIALELQARMNAIAGESTRFVLVTFPAEGIDGRIVSNAPVEQIRAALAGALHDFDAATGKTLALVH